MPWGQLCLGQGGAIGCGRTEHFCFLKVMEVPFPNCHHCSHSGASPTLKRKKILFHKEAFAHLLPAEPSLVQMPLEAAVAVVCADEDVTPVLVSSEYGSDEHSRLRQHHSTSE